MAESESDFLYDGRSEKLNVLFRSLTRSIKSSMGRAGRGAVTARTPIDWEHAAQNYVGNQNEILLDRVFDIGRVSRQRSLELSEAITASFAPSLDAVYGIVELARHVNDLCSTNWKSPRIIDNKVSVLARLQAHSTLVAEEIFLLASSGYPSGATARVRALYELMITARALSESDAEISERYEHSHLFELKRQWDDSEVLDEQLTPEVLAEVNELRSRVKAAVGRFGDSMTSAYGWAAPLKESKGSPNFSWLNEEFSDPKSKGFYRPASHHVHGNFTGTLKAMAGDEPGVFVYGPRFQGLFEAASSCVRYLVDINYSLLDAATEANPHPEIFYWHEVMRFSAIESIQELVRAQTSLDPEWGWEIVDMAGSIGS